MQNENTRNVMALYEIENIDNANICMIAVNPKEYFEKLKIDESIKNIKE